MKLTEKEFAELLISAHALVDYVYNSEYRHYEECGRPRLHIFRDAVRMGKLIKKLET